MAKQQPMQQFFDNVAEANRTIWNQWVEGVSKGNFSSLNEQLDRTYKENLDVAEKLVQDTLHAQGDFVEQWCRSISASDAAPKPVVDMTENFRTTMDSWLGARSELWTKWFDGARKLDAEHLLPMANGRSGFLKMWEDFSRKAVEMQEGVTRAASDAAEETGKAARDAANVVSTEAASATGSAAGSSSPTGTATKRSASKGSSKSS